MVDPLNKGDVGSSGDRHLLCACSAARRLGQTHFHSVEIYIRALSTAI
jgi:hypothetical protein